VRAFYCDHFVLPLPAGHRFPMRKYALLRERLAGDPHIRLEVPAAATDEALLRAHTPDYVRAVVTGSLEPGAIRRLGFPWSPALVERSRRSVGGTLAACRAALVDGSSANLAGGTHHAFPDRGEGFCVFNDTAVAARTLLAERPDLRRIAIVDLDVHQGDGTAAIFRDDDRVFTLSVHGAHNYPFRKQRSDLDLALPDGTRDDAYLDAVARGLDAALATGPDLAIYVAGADPYEGDKLGRLAVSLEGLARRDRLVGEACRREGVPLAVVMAGGYARHVDDTVSVHAQTVREAARGWSLEGRDSSFSPAPSAS
jgi:acetoin utilization deacetylase AcuC-like enzyme